MAESTKRWIDERGSYVPLEEKAPDAITPWMAIIRQRGIDWLPLLIGLLTPDAQSKSHPRSPSQKRLSTSFAKEEGKKNDWEWKKGKEKGGQHIDLQLPCVSNHVKSCVPCDQSSGWVISHTSSCCSGEFRKPWIRSGFEGSLRHVRVV